jgi:hypothetical protein
LVVFFDSVAPVAFASASATILLIAFRQRQQQLSWHSGIPHLGYKERPVLANVGTKGIEVKELLCLFLTHAVTVHENLDALLMGVDGNLGMVVVAGDTDQGILKAISQEHLGINLSQSVSVHHSPRSM